MKDLPKTWKWVTLGEVCDFLDSKRVPVNEADRTKRISGKSVSELFPYYGANGQVGWIDSYIFDEPLILLAEDGGKFGSATEPIAYEVSGKYWVNNHAHVLRPRPEINFRYCLYSISIRPDILKFVAGTTRQKLNQAKASQIPIPLPPLAEQERIVCLLDEAEALRKLRAQAIARMDEFVPALFHEMFGDPANANYPIKNLGSIADVVSGIAKGRKFNGQKSVTVNYLRVANVQAGYLDLSEIKTIEALPEEVEALQVKVGDVLLTEGGDFDKLGRGAMLEVDLPNCIHQNHVFRARVNQDYLLPDFLHDFLQTQQAKNYFLSCAKKTTNLASINLTQLRALPVPLPPLPLQQEFARRVQEAREIQTRQAQSAERIEALYQSMLSRAFAGEL